MDPYSEHLNTLRQQYQAMSDEELVWHANSGNDQSPDRKLARQMLYAREQARSNNQFTETQAINNSVRRWTIAAVVLTTIAAIAAIASVVEGWPHTK